MTALLAPPPDNRLWSSMPGWGIVADLTPPELIAARHLRALRKLIVVGLTLVVALCAGGYVLAVRQHSSATSARDAVTARGADLQRQLNSKAFLHVITIQGTVAKVQGQVATLLKDDIDLPALLTEVALALPASMKITTLSVSLASGGTAAQGGSGTSLDTSGHPVIGTVIVTGSGHKLDDLPMYVDRLATLPGVVNVVPTSNQATNGAVSYNMTFSLTNKLYSHRYDAAKAGGK